MKVKCVVWDLDNTIWSGILSEDKNVTIIDSIVEIIHELDNRGILQSIASKNNFRDAMNKLKEFGIDEFFLYPQINWNAKSESLCKIAEELNIGIDSFLFLDDQEFELAEVKYHLPEILVMNIKNSKNHILKMEELIPTFVTDETSIRRILYQREINRNEMEEKFEGTNIDFLNSLNLNAIFRKASKKDLQRVEELTLRTNQLNTTGITYSYEELLTLLKDKNYLIVVAQLSDSFGSYGTVGLAVIKKELAVWTVKLFLVSCRVISRNLGSVFLNWIRNLAFEENVMLKADFRKTKKNRMMYLTYKMMELEEETDNNGDTYFYEKRNTLIQQPDYIAIKEELE